MRKRPLSDFQMLNVEFNQCHHATQLKSIRKQRAFKSHLALKCEMCTLRWKPSRKFCTLRWKPSRNF